ncbi:MAG: MATE family multidrug resistance protein [Limisphaerales bacterium]
MTDPSSLQAPETHSDEASDSFDVKKELKQMAILGWPIVLTQLFIMMTGTIDTAMAGHYSSMDLAGVSLGGMFMWPAFMLLSGITMALTPITAQLRGAKKTDQIGHQIRQGLWVCMFTSTLLVLVMVNAGGWYTYVGVDAEAIRIAREYLQAAAWGAPPVIFYVALRHSCEGLGQPRPPMVIAGSIIPLNALLNYGFIYGKFGLPELGGVGCGYATAIIFWVQFFAMLFVCRMQFFRRIEAFTQFEWPDWQSIKSILYIGTPIGLTIFVEMAVFSVIGLMIARFSILEVAANSIAGNINWATYVIPAAIGSAASIRVGFHVGAKDYVAARGSAIGVYKFSFIYALVIGLLLVATRFYLVSIFTTDQAVVEIATALLIFIAVYQLVDDSNAVAIGALRGFKDTRFPFVFGLIGYWFLALPFGYAVSEGIIFPGMAPGVYGYWLAITLGLAIVAIAMGFRLRNISRDFKKIAQLADT